MADLTVPVGDLLRPGDLGYDEARTLFNAMIDRRPAAIARCSSAEDVAGALGYAREQGLEVCVRGGGHSAAGHSVIEGALMIDLSPMNDVVVDAGARTARVGGGATWGDVDRATEPHGLATPGGRITSTGVAGLTLGGGQGWMSSPHGLSCDNLLAIEAVTVDGRVVTASETSNADLFWAMRGGGGNFAIATEFTFRLHPIHTPMLAGQLVFPIQRIREVIRGWRDAFEAAPDELASAIVVLTAPHEEFVPPPVRGTTVLGMAVAWFGAPEEAEAAVAPLRALGPAVDLVAPMPYTALQAMIDAANPAGLRNYWTADYLDELTDEAIEAFAAASEGGAPAPTSHAILFPLGAAANRVPADATAFGARSARYIAHPIALWDGAENDEANLAWARGVSAAMKPFATGTGYLNLIADPGEERLRSAFGPNYDRLVAIKRTWDPENVLRHNHNIKP